MWFHYFIFGIILLRYQDSLPDMHREKKIRITKKNKDPYHFIFLPEEPGLQLESVDHLLAGLLAVHKALGKPVHILR